MCVPLLLCVEASVVKAVVKAVVKPVVKAVVKAVVKPISRSPLIFFSMRTSVKAL